MATAVAATTARNGTWIQKQMRRTITRPTTTTSGYLLIQLIARGAAQSIGDAPQCDTSHGIPRTLAARPEEVLRAFRPLCFLSSSRRRRRIKKDTSNGEDITKYSHQEVDHYRQKTVHLKMRNLHELEPMRRGPLIGGFKPLPLLVETNGMEQLTPGMDVNIDIRKVAIYRRRGATAQQQARREQKP